MFLDALSPPESTDLFDALAGLGASDVVSRGDVLTLLFVVVLMYLVGQVFRAGVAMVNSVVKVMLAVGGILTLLTLAGLLL